MGEKRNEDSNKTIRQSDLVSGVAQAARAKAEPDIERTIAAALPRKAEEIKAAEAEVPLEWNIGDVILDLYEVKDIHKGGGMGLVYRVRHRGWNIDLAVKSPRADYFQTEEQKKNFVCESETWINLGLYPHTVSCYYVRNLGGIPRVFAEYVEGGSLSDWIKTRKLYEGGPDGALERILDMAIQFAWGLHYAHEQGLIHQDVKPANVMMTPAGTPKVTDFGLAKARGLAGESARILPGRSILVSTGGMTPAYCSPEQALGKPLSRKTDIWSWGLSVLEMFTGEVTWMAGQAAAEVLVSYIDTGAEDEAIPKMPEPVVELLRQCFQRDPKDRPEDMKEIITKLIQSYQGATGEAYSRPEPKAADLLADGLNNRAISLLDLGRQDEAERLLERVLQTDPHQLEATYNRGLVLWRWGRMTDEVLVRQLEEVRKIHEREWRVEYYLGLVHIERGDGESAAKILEDASRRAPQEEEIQRALAVVRGPEGNWYCWVRTLEGHTDWVNSVSISPDGRWGLSGGRDETLRLWELATGQCVRTFKGHTGFVRSVSISPDGHWGLSGSNDYTLRLWELATGRCVRTFEGHTFDVTSVSISPDGRWALSGSDDRTLRLWELATGNCVRTFEGHTEEVNSVSISPDGRWALSGSGSYSGRDFTLRLWELATGKCVRTSEGHLGPVYSVAFSPDGRWALSGSSDKTLRLWELATGKCVRTFEGRASLVLSVTFSPDGRWALSGSDDRTLQLLELRRSGPPGPLAIARPRSSVEAVREDTEFRGALKAAKLALEKGDASRAAAEVSRARQIPGYERHGQLLELWWQIRLSGSPRCFSGGWLYRTLKTIAPASPAYVSISPDGRWGLSGSFDGRLRLWDLATGQCVRTFRGHMGEVHSVAISPDGRWGLSGSNDSGSNDNALRLWDLATGQSAQNLDGHIEGVESVTFSPDARWAVSGSLDKTLRLWELATGRCLRTFEGHTEPVTSVSISPDGQWALSGSEDKTLRLWDLATGKCVRTFEGHTEEVTSVGISPDGRRALSGSKDKTLRLWDLATGKCVRTFESHTEEVLSVNISPDGRWALSGGYDQTLRLWELATGECLYTFEGDMWDLASVSITYDWRWVLSGSWDLTLRLWELDWEYEFPSPIDWDEGARPYLESFLNLHTPYAAELSRDHIPSEEEIRLALTRRGEPTWSDQEFDVLIRQLQYAGYGWLRPEGIQRELKKMTQK